MAFKGVDFYRIDDLLTDEERMVRDTVRRFDIRKRELQLHYRVDRVERIVECSVQSVPGHLDKRAAVVGVCQEGSLNEPASSLSIILNIWS